MAKYKVDISGINTSSLKPLTNGQNLELFQKMKEGDPFARDDLINGNLKLVLSILKKFNNKVDNLDDLFQVGCLGLVKAIDNFDTSYNVTLSTYACPLIIGEMKRYIRDNSSLRISRSVKDIAYKTMKLTEELSQITDLHLTTDNGECGFHGHPVKFLTENNIDFDYYYSCGPLRMLEGLAKYSFNGCLSLEARMGCGFGACMGCTIKTTNGNKRVCKEGPVFDADEVIF